MFRPRLNRSAAALLGRVLLASWVMSMHFLGCTGDLDYHFTKTGKESSPTYYRCDNLTYSTALTSDGSLVCQMLINASATLPLRVPIGESRSYVLDYFRITGLSPSAVPPARVRVVGWISDSGAGSDPEGVSDWVDVASPDPAGKGTWSATVGESQYGTLPVMSDPFFLVEIERPKEEDCSTYPTVQFCINIKSE